MKSARLVASAAVAVIVLTGPSPASATAQRAGTATVVRNAGTSVRLNSGGSGTTFSLDLPGDSSCPGDSANDGYRVQSFLVPAKDDPGALTYFSVMPVGKGRYALYDIYTNPYIQAQTAKQLRPGGPGPIIDIPAFNFAVFPPGLLPGGRYRIGIACSLHNNTVRYWDNEIDLVRAPSDKPAELHWRVIGTHASHPVNWLSWALGAAALAAVAYALVSWRSSGHGAAESRITESVEEPV
ncbi:MAG: hypothetical protein JO054_05825 [Actinobacteria bacterium]|nr:hypothetical protein [Actinomycetota bacterium]MBV9253729.1 hypothetical protein [Actinomycetota bacterium]